MHFEFATATPTDSSFDLPAVFRRTDFRMLPTTKRWDTMFLFCALQLSFAILASNLVAAPTPQAELIGAKRGNGSFEKINPSDASVKTGSRRATKQRGSFEFPGWTITNQRGFVGVDGTRPAADGKQYLFANAASIMEVTSDPIKRLNLKAGDGLQLDFQFTGSAKGTAIVRLVYQLDDFQWTVGSHEIEVKTPDKYTAHSFTSRVPLDASRLSLELTVDTFAKKTNQVRLDNVQLKRIKAKDLPPLPTELYVATDGDDANPGTLERPFRTVQAAANRANPGMTVFIRKGIYQEKVTVNISGVPGRPIVFRPYKNERVVISTADTVTGWQKVKGDINGDRKPDSGVWVANVGDDTGGKRECNTVFADGKLRFEAKHFAEGDPLEFDNWGKVKKGDIDFNQLRSDQLKGGQRNFWAGAKVRHHTTDWSFNDSTIKSYDPATGTLKYAKKLGYLISQKQEFGFYIFDSIKTLDKPGEWFKDTNGKLYYYPLSGENPNKTRVAFKRRDFTFDVRGQSHITIDGLVLEGGALEMSDDNHHIRLINGKLFGYGKGQLGAFRFRGDHNAIENNEIYQAFESLTVVSGSFHRIVNNFCHDITYKLSQRSMSMSGHSHLISYNTFYKFARNMVGVFPFRSEYSYNVFERGGTLSWDTAVFDGDANSGDGGGCVIHHNVFRNSPTNGAYFAIYSGVDLVFHHNLVFNFGPEHRHHGSAQCMKFYHNTFVGANPQGVRIGSSTPFQSSYCNNIQLVDDRVKTLGVEFRGNYNHGKRDFVNPADGDFRLAKGSPAIDCGVVLPGINDGFKGKAPDAGAIEFGEKLWKVGHDFKTPPTIQYQWQTVAGMNLEENGQFEVGAPSSWTHIGEPRLFNGNTWNTLKRGLSPTGGRSYEIETGEGIERVFDVKPSTHYQVAVDCRLVGHRIRLVDFDKNKGSVDKKKHRAEEYVFGFGQGEWLMYQGVDFGDKAAKFNEAELLYSRHSRDSSRSDAASSRFDLRIDAPNGPLLGTFTFRESVNESWYVTTLKGIKPITGKHDVYLVPKGRGCGKMYLARMRLLHDRVADENSLAVVAEQPGAAPLVSFAGRTYWNDDYESYTLVTGDSAEKLTVKLNNTGDYTAYVDRFALMEIGPTENVNVSIPQPSDGADSAIARFHCRPEKRIKLDQIRLGMKRKSGSRGCSLRVKAWTVPDINDPDAPHDQERFVFWEKKYVKTWDADEFELLLKGTDLGDQRNVPLNSQPVGVITVEVAPGNQWSLESISATGDRQTDLVRTDGQIEQDNGKWSCTFTQEINIGEIRALHPGSRTLPETQIVLKNGDGRVVWKKKIRKGQQVDWTGSLVLDGSTRADGARTRLGSIVAQKLEITTKGKREFPFTDVQVRNQATAPPVKNLALRSTATQSSDLYGDKSFASVANNAVLQPYLDFTSTDDEKNPWLDLVLEKPSDIAQIVLYNRATSDKRIGNFRVSAIDPKGKTVWSEDYSWKRGDLAGGKRLTIDKRIRNVQKVRVQIKGKNYLHLAEVMIWAE